MEMLSLGYANWEEYARKWILSSKAFLLVSQICIPMAPLIPALKGTAVTLVVMGWGGGFCCFSFILAPGIAF